MVNIKIQTIITWVDKIRSQGGMNIVRKIRMTYFMKGKDHMSSSKDEKSLIAVDIWVFKLYGKEKFI